MTRGPLGRLLLWLCVCVGLLVAGSLNSLAWAQTPPATEAQKAKVQELVKLLDDPDVRAWLASTSPLTEPAASELTVADQLQKMEGGLRAHLAELRQAAKRLPAETAAAMQAFAAEGGGTGRIALMLFGVLLAGVAVEYLVRTRLKRASGLAQPQTAGFATSVFSNLAPVAAFALASLCAFIALPGSALLRSFVLAYLIALILIRFAAETFRLLARLVDGLQEPVRLSDPGPNASWPLRATIFVGYLLLGWATVSLLPKLGFSAGAVELLTYVAGIGLLLLAIETVWRMPSNARQTTIRKWSVTVFLVVLWVMWCLGLTLGLWLGIYALLLPPLLSLAGRAAAAIVGTGDGQQSTTPIRDVLISRGARAAVILLAVLWLGRVVSINPGVLLSNDVAATVIVRGLLRGVIILLVADLVWQLLKVYVDGKISVGGSADGATSAELARRGRLRTLLPIFRNGLAVLIITIAGLMILSELGVEIGPLIAGAGIFGVAIGFGSQTLVKDIVSGVFYLMDDAFRVGEYIQSGSYKGTVESFSLRSVRLRHHRGPVFTVPFGSLGAVQNMSRDWVIDKFMIRVPFNTDIKLVKKLTKEVGQALLDDPDAGQYIIDTVKMKGIEQFGDYGMEVSFKLMTKPGQQIAVRRRAHAMIRDAFVANGITFAQPTVNVEGDDRAGAAASIVNRKPSTATEG